MIDLDRIEDIFEKRYRDLCHDEDSLKNDTFFIDWCDKHKIVMLHPDWLMDTLNEGKMKGMVCIHSPEKGRDPAPWLLIPKKLAEKTLVLGYLP